MIQRLLVALALFVIAPGAHAGVRLSLLSQIGYSMNTQSTLRTMGIGGGATLAVTFSPKVGMETGGFVFSRGLSTTIHVPLKLRIEPNKNFSIGFGPHLEIPMTGGALGIGGQVDARLALFITPNFAFVIGPQVDYVFYGTPGWLDLSGVFGFRIGA